MCGYHDEIVELLEKPGVSKKAVYNEAAEKVEKDCCKQIQQSFFCSII